MRKFPAFVVSLLIFLLAPQAQSQTRIEQAVEQEKVREAWEIGKLIDEHILHHKERADYDKEVLSKLATDLEISESELHRMLKFARIYPSILAAPPELSWSHYQSLLALNDPKERTSSQSGRPRNTGPATGSGKKSAGRTIFKSPLA